MTLATELNLEDPEVLERGRILFEQPCSFVIGCVKLEQVPAEPMAPDTYLDLLWHDSYFRHGSDLRPGWNGYMQERERNNFIFPISS